MHAHDLRALPRRLGDTRQRTAEPILDRRVKHLADERFTRRPDDDRMPQRDKRLEMAQQCEIVCDCFAKTQTRIDENLVAANPYRFRLCERLTEKVEQFMDDIAIARTMLHRLRSATHVHQDDRHAVLRNHRGHTRIPAKRGDIIHHRGPRVNSGLCDVGFRSIDGQRNGYPLRQRGDDRHDAAALLVGRNRSRTRARRLAADIDQARSGTHHLLGMAHGVIGITISASIAEGIRRDIEDAHHPGDVVPRTRP